MAENLPRDIMVEILLKLSVKTLVRFRCVSKSWRYLISDPKFIDNHLRSSTTDDTHANQKVILTCTDPYFTLKSCSIWPLFNESSVDAEQLVDVFEKPLNCVSVVGSCNGLLCIVVEHETVYLWNPAIRELRKLPDSGFRMEDNCSISYGLGFDSRSDDYKVVSILSRFGPRNSGEKIVKVYERRSNDWRRVGDFPYEPTNEPGLFVCGALNWYAVRFDGSEFRIEQGRHIRVMHMSSHILAIDLSTEKCNVVPQPDNLYSGFDQSLAKLRECLCLLAHYRGNRADIWVMKEYGVKESWSKMFTIGYRIDNRYPDCYPYYRPLVWLKNGELLLEFKSRLILYNSEDTTLRTPVVHNFETCFRSIAYVESLVSPNARGFC